MNKHVLFALGTCMSFFGYSQTTPMPSMNTVNIVKPFNKTLHTGSEAMRPNDFVSLRSANNSSNGLKIGQTTYDLQTNASIQNRLLLHNDGTISAVWTYSTTYDIAAADRGTGYAYFNGTAWSGTPSSRIETERGGWPSILSINGNEYNTLHNTQSSVITENKRANKGSGTWSESDISSQYLIWNRTANGGPNNQTIHMVGVTAPTGNGGTVYQGLDGALVYYRSLDGGTTWDQQDVVIPGMDSSLFNGFGGDGYQIKAKGNTVVIAVFNQWDDSFIMKSVDNGTTWTKKTFMDIPFTKYVADQPGGSDINGDNIADTISTTDNSGAVAIDDNGMAHVFYGNMRVLDDDLTDGNTSYFPYTNGLVYWNENMDANEQFFIAWAEDFDGDGQVANGNETDIAAYFASLASYPDVVIDGPNIYVTYSAYMENKSNGAQSYRHVYMVTSNDGGCTWNEFEDMTPNDDFAECMFASIANDVDDSIRFIYQEDIEPGLAVRGDEDSYDMNNIVYISKATSSLNTTTNECATWISGESEFCFGDSTELIASCGTSYLWSTGATTPSIFVNTFGTFNVQITTSCGRVDTIEITTTQPTSAPTVITSGTVDICGNNPVDISVNSVSSASYLWSNGETTRTTTVTQAGTYTVTVTNCGGTSTGTVIVQPAQLPSNQLSYGSLIVCEGQGNVTLNANEGISWLWNNGDTTQSLTLSSVSESGWYHCEIYNACGDFVTSDSVEVVINETPNQPTITNTGGNIWESSASSGNQWYVDGTAVNGETNQTFDASTYLDREIYVVVTNSAGCSSTSEEAYPVGLKELAILNEVKLYPNPATNMVTIKVGNIKAPQIHLNSLTGQLIQTISVKNNSQMNLDLSNLSAGIYLVKITSDNVTATQKLIIE